MAAGDAERRYVVGSGWQTVAVSASGIVTAADVDSDGAANGEVLTADGGGGASWEVGGGGSLPAWWTVDSTPGSESVEFAGAVTIAPTDTNANRLVLEQDGDTVFTVFSGGRVAIAAPVGFADFGPLLALGATAAQLGADPFLRITNDGGDAFVVGPTGAVTISPSSADVSGLTISLPDEEGQNGFQIFSPESGSMGWDPVNGFFVSAATGSDALARFEDSDGNGVAEFTAAGEIGFFDATPVTQPAAPADVNDVIAGLQALGLFAT